MVGPNIIGASLCIDVLLELFHYFYVDEIFHSFNEVVHHLPSVLRTGQVQLHVRRIDKHFRKYILPNIDCHNVWSIQIPNLYHMASIDLSQFDQVRFLILRNVTTKNWPDRFPEQLRSLILFVRSKDREKVFHQALGLDHIQRLEFHSSFLHFRECHRILPKPSKIKHLIFTSRCSCIDYQFLVNNMPYLRTLRSTLTYHPHRFEANLSRFRCLHTIELSCRYTDIKEMISLLSQITVKSLRRCQLVNINNSLSSRIAAVLIS